MKKRSHKNTRRLTAKERAEAAVNEYYGSESAAAKWPALVRAIQRALAAHARQALRRDDARDRR